MNKLLFLITMFILIFGIWKLIKSDGYIELKKYINEYKPMDISLIEEEIEALRKENYQLLLTFFQREELDEASSNNFFLKKFRVHNIEVLQYQNADSNGIYTLSGTINSLFLFLYTLGKEYKNYQCNAISFTTNNNLFTGTIEISRPNYNPNLGSQEYRDTNLESKYISTLENKFITKKTTERTIREAIIVDFPIEAIETIKTSKFYYVGLKKEVNEPIYFFKDSDTGRIYKLPLGGFLGEWKLTEKENNNFYFSYLNKRLVISL